MKKLLFLFTVALVVAAVGCSDDDNPTGSNQPVNTDAPVLAAIGSQTLYVDSTMNLMVMATDVDSTTPVLSTSTLPAGATFVDKADGSGMLMWSAVWDDIAIHNVTFYAADAADSTAVDSEIVEITIIPAGTATSGWDIADGHWETNVNGSDYDSFKHFSFADMDTTAAGAKAAHGWDIAFRREVVKLNGGSSTSNNGEVVGADLGVVDFESITIDDTAGVSWDADAIDYFIDEWYSYNSQTHQLSANQYVYSMLDAEGDNYVKFRVDSMVGAGFPPDMGTVYISYFYQSTVDSRDLSGTVVEASIPVGPGTGYFDFSVGAATTPADPANSTDWDIAFNNYNCMQNSGPNGSGSCAAFPAFGELTDSTDIAGFTSQPAGAPLFTDIPSSAMTGWYEYNGVTHQLTSKSHVYLVQSAGSVYKLRVESYYTNVGGLPASGHYTFIWSEL